MEIIYNLPERLGFILFFIFCFLIGTFLVFTGNKIKKESKSSGMVLRVIGVLFMIASLFLLLFSIFFGFNS